MPGLIESITGPMYAGKTSELLKRILWLNHSNLRIEVIKPIIDDRYIVDSISTHTGQQYSCHNADNLYDTLISIPALMSVHTIFIDEIQFFSIDDIKKSFEMLLSTNINVVVAGLDQDSSGIPFESTAYVLALSDEIYKIKSFCNICGQPASKTYKLKNTGSRVDVGSHNVYDARCILHWEPRK